MNDLKIGDKVKVLPGGVDIWVHTGKVYIILGFVYEPEVLPHPRDCTPSCKQIKDYIPARTFYTVNTKLGEPVTILSTCFEKILNENN